MTVTYTTKTLPDGQEIADVDVSQLTRREAHDLRLELTEQLFHPLEDTTEEQVTFYKAKIEEIKAFLVTD